MRQERRGIGSAVLHGLHIIRYHHLHDTGVVLQMRDQRAAASRNSARNTRARTGTRPARAIAEAAKRQAAILS